MLTPAGFATGAHEETQNTMELRPFCATSHERADMPILSTKLIVAAYDEATPRRTAVFKSTTVAYTLPQAPKAVLSVSPIARSSYTGQSTGPPSLEYDSSGAFTAQHVCIVCIK